MTPPHLRGYPQHTVHGKRVPGKDGEHQACVRAKRVHLSGRGGGKRNKQQQGRTDSGGGNKVAYEYWYKALLMQGSARNKNKKNPTPHLPTF